MTFVNGDGAFRDDSEPYVHWRGVDHNGVPSVGFTRGNETGVKVHEQPNPSERYERHLYNEMLHAAMTSQTFYGQSVRMK